MKTVEEICKYIRHHKNTPDLHTAIIHTKTNRILLDYDYDCFSVVVMNDNSSKRAEFKTIPEVISFIGTNEIEWYDM